MKVSLEQEAVRSLISPKGANDSLVQALHIRQYQRTLALLSQIKRKLVAESEELVERTMFTQAFNVLGNSPSHVQRAVLSYPAVGFWLDVAWDLISRGSHIRFPEMHMQMHLEEFWRIALAAGYISEDISFSCTTWSDKAGNISLPGAGIYLATPTRTSYQKLRLQINNGVITGRRFNGENDSPIEITPFKIPKAVQNVELNSVDLDLQLPGRTNFEYERIGPESEIRWKSTLEQVWEWIIECDPLLAEEINLSTKAIVPLVSESIDVHISATFRESPGLMALSWTPDASVMTEAVVHEYHHQKLNALLNLDPIILGPTSEAIFYSPWRKDPRPLMGLLHGAYVFQAVLEFWKHFFDAGIPLLHEERVFQRMYLIAKQVKSALDLLAEKANFSLIGESLLSGMFENLALYNKNLPKLSKSIQQNLDTNLANHLQQWNKENSHLLSNSISPKHNIQNSNNSQSTIEHQALDWLNLDSGIDLSSLRYSRYPMDPLLDAIIFAYHERGLDELATIIGNQTLEESLILDLIRGHVAYVQDDYFRAATHYDSCLSNVPANPYFWECFAFAVRHLARWDEAELILTNLGSLIADHPLAHTEHTGKNPIETRIEHVKSILNPNLAI